MLFEGQRKTFEKDGGQMPGLPDYDPTLQVRVSYLFRVKALISVGCHFAPNDLEPATWDQLLLLESEQAYLDKVLERRREKKGQADAAANKARAQTGVPAPGGTIFPTTKPFRGPTR